MSDAQFVTALRSQFSAALAEARTIGQPSGVAIPRQIVQFWNDPVPPDDVAALIAGWAALPGYEHRLFNDRSALDFIETNYTWRQVAAFRHCHHPAMRADYFRLAWLLKNGGVYIDADERCRGDLVLGDADLQLQLIIWAAGEPPGQRMVPLSRCHERGDGWAYYFANAPIICVPEHPVVAAALERATARVLAAANAGRTANIHHDTGPMCITEALFGAVSAAIAGGTPLPSVGVIEWDKIATVCNAQYKAGERNWRHNAVMPPHP